MSYGLLLIRLVVGGTMFGHGAQKLFGWFDGPGPKGMAGFLGSLGFRAPLLMGIVAGLAESSGLAFAAGFLTPLASLAIAIVMLNAIALVHWSKGFWNANGGLEFPLILLTVAVSVAATGPGRYSLDRAIGWDDNISGVWWGVGVLVTAAAISFLTVTIGRKRHALRTAAA